MARKTKAQKDAEWKAEWERQQQEAKEEYQKVFQLRLEKSDPGVPESILLLWDSIEGLNYAHSEVGGVGNSGEFYTDEDARKADKELKDAEESFERFFSVATGWKPVKFSYKPKPNSIWNTVYFVRVN